MTPSPWNRINSTLCNLVHLAARCDIAAGGAVSATSVAPLGAAWTSPATGRYLLTLSADNPLVSANLTFPSVVVQSATAQDLVASVSVLTTTTIEIRLCAAAVATAPAAACAIHLNILASNSTVQVP